MQDGGRCGVRCFFHWACGSGVFYKTPNSLEALSLKALWETYIQQPSERDAVLCYSATMACYGLKAVFNLLAFSKGSSVQGKGFSLQPNPQHWGEDGESGGKSTDRGGKSGFCLLGVGRGTALQRLIPAATLPGCRNVLAPAQKWPTMTRSPRAGHDAGA